MWKTAQLNQKSDFEFDTSRSLLASRFVTGYLLAVTMSVACFLALSLIRVIADRTLSGMYPARETVFVAFSDLLTFPVLWLIAFTLSILPCALILALAWRFNIRSLFYYAAMGAAVGLVETLILTYMLHGFRWYSDSLTEPQLNVWHEFINSVCVFSVVGAFGGIIFWLYTIRHYQGINKVN